MIKFELVQTDKHSIKILLRRKNLNIKQLATIKKIEKV